MPDVLHASWTDTVREHWRFFAIVALVSVLMFAYSFQSAPVAYADAACGDTPDWWTTQYISWLACEVQNNGASSTITQVVSPVFNSIDTDIQNMSSSINNTLGGLPGQIGSAVASALLPQSSDMQPLTDEITSIQSTPSIQTVTSAFTVVTNFSDALSGYVIAPTDPTQNALPAGTYEYMGSTYSMGAPDNFMLGVAMFFAWITNGGISRDMLYGIEDTVFALVAAGSILGDLGVNIGALGGSIRLLDNMYGEGATQRELADREREVMRQRREWSWGERVRSWERGRARDAERAFRSRGTYKYPGPWPDAFGGGATKTQRIVNAKRQAAWSGIDDTLNALRGGTGVGQHYYRDVGSPGKLGKRGYGRGPSRKGLGRRSSGSE